MPAIGKLREHLAARGLNLTTFAPLVGKSASTLSRVLNSKVTPEYEIQLAIRDATNGEVQPNDWYPPEAA